MFNNKECLYHYTSAETAIDYILKNKTLKLGSFRNVNDPKEAKTWPFKFLCFKSETKELFNSELFDEVHNHIMDRTFVVCFKKDDLLNEQQDEPNSIKGYSDSRMWSQYANNHKGVCLVFNKKKLTEKINKIFKNDIIFNDFIKYLDYGQVLEFNQDYDPYIIFFEKMLSLGIEKYLKEHIFKFNKDLFFTKQTCWRDEEEYRWVVYSSNKVKDKYIPINDCLEAIVLGNDFDSKYLNQITCYAKECGIKLYKLFNRGWAQHLFECDLENMYCKDIISLNGVSYPIDFYYELLFTQACNINGERKTILLDFPNNGSVILYD
ncbi:DUF2971 domain-containing protein [Clostridium botulinum]|nr:DUF2971 domain-containing protein [Clostridium botulinum]NFN49891.1 DUF2971 domain-containing protein [Clostridium botulinum]